MRRTCGTKTTSTDQRLFEIDHWVTKPCFPPEWERTLQRKDSYLKDNQYHSFNIIWHKVILTFRKMNCVPVPVVWSPEGPVPMLGVALDHFLHSKLVLLTFFVDQWGQDPSKSKSQSRGPAKKPIAINQSIGKTMKQLHAFKGNCHHGSREDEQENDLQWPEIRCYLLRSSPIRDVVTRSLRLNKDSSDTVIQNLDGKIGK